MVTSSNRSNSNSSLFFLGVIFVCLFNIYFYLFIWPCWVLAAAESSSLIRNGTQASLHWKYRVLATDHTRETPGVLVYEIFKI